MGAEGVACALESVRSYAASAVLAAESASQTLAPRSSSLCGWAGLEQQQSGTKRLTTSLAKIGQAA